MGARLAVVATMVAAGLAACGDPPPRGVLETKHCVAALAVLNKALGETTVGGTRTWEGDGTFNVAVDYTVAVDNPDRREPVLQRDTILCRYALVPRRPDIPVDVVAMRQRGVDLTDEQMRIVNTALKVFR